MSSKITGLVSGFDTQSIVESFMAIEKVSYNKLEYKHESANLKLQAYQAVNSYIMKFKGSMNSIASKSLWNSKAAVTTNEKALTATASEYAVNGSYSFKVAQLATSTQYMSKGFASKNTSLGIVDEDNPPKSLGSINLSSGKSRVDNSAELESLNGGRGVYRGSVRITDASGTTSTIDLSSCTTMDDVVMKLNESQGAQISAYLKEGRLVVEDASNGSGTLKISNVGTGTTATDLGIVGAGEADKTTGVMKLEGRNVYIMGNDTGLKELNDGLGVEEGEIILRISNGSGSYLPLGIDTTGCKTVGDLVKAANNAIERAVKLDTVDLNGGLHSSELAGLSFSVSEDGTSFALNGTKAGLSYGFYDPASSSMGKPQPATDLGLKVGQIITSTGDGESIKYDRIFGGVNSPMLNNLGGANGTGVGASGDWESVGNLVPIPVTRNTKLSAMNEGKGLGVSTTVQIRVYEGGKYTADGTERDPTFIKPEDFLNPADMKQWLNKNPNATIGDIEKKINDELIAYAESGKPGAAAVSTLRVKFDDDIGAFTWEGAQTGYEYEITGEMVNDLGMLRTNGGKPASLGLETSSKGGAAIVGENDIVRQQVYNNINYYKNGSSKTNLISGNNFLDIKDKDGNPTNVTMDTLNPEALGFDSVEEFLESLEDTGFHFSYGTNPPTNVSVAWNDVLSKFKDENGDFDASAIKVEDFLDSFNSAVADELEAMGDDAKGLFAPQLTVKEGGRGFGWSNVNYMMDLEISGAGFDTLDLTRKSAPSVVSNGDHLGDPAATLGTLDPAKLGYASVDDFVDSLRGGELEFVYNTYIDENDNEVKETVKVKWDDVLALLDDGSGNIDVDNVSIKDFCNAVNTVIKDEFEAEGYKGNVPIFTIRGGGDGFTWVNAGKLEISGAGAAELDLERNGYDQIGNGFDFGNFNEIPDRQLMTPPKLAMSPGFAREEIITSTNAKDHALSELNLGFGLNVYGDRDETIELYFDPKGNDKLTITMGEIYDKLQARADADTDGNIQALSVQDYLDVLNELTEPKLEEMNDGKKDKDKISFKWGVVENEKKGNGIGLVDVKNIDKSFALTGTAFGVDEDGVSTGPFKTGMYLGVYEPPEEGETKIQVGGFNAATFHQLDEELANKYGVGYIDMSLGNGEVVRLYTDGLTKESTLADLIDKLNSELGALADGSHSSYWTQKLDTDGKPVVDADGNPVMVEVEPPPYDKEARKAFADIKFAINSSGTGIAVENTSNRSITFHDTKSPDDGRTDGNFLAQDLGLIKDKEETGKFDSYSFTSAGSVGRKYISRASDLEDWIGKGTEKGGIRLTDSAGIARTIDLSNAETIGDIIDAINSYWTVGDLAIKAELNETGDGFRIFEDYSNYNGKIPLDDERSEIYIEDVLGGGIAQKLGFAGKGNSKEYGVSYMDVSFTKKIEVMTSDTLEDVMYRISEAGYKAAIINDGTSSNPFRLTVSSNGTGEANDFVIDTDIEMFDFGQTQRGRDAKVLYGDPNSTSSPVMLTSTTNTNSSAILGINLEMKSVSDEWTTITVDTDKEKVAEEIEGMVQAYNDLTGIIAMLDGYDPETGEKGILFGDTTVRKMMEEIDSFFYQVYDPYNLGIGGLRDGEQATWTWADMGISLTAGATETDEAGNGTGWYSAMSLDSDKLQNMISSNWEVLEAMLYGERNAANSNLGNNIAPSASFNGGLEDGYDVVDSAINGDSSKSNWGVNNGIMASDTIKNGSDTYTMVFPKATTITRMNVFFPASDTSLKDYDIEYMDPATGEWVKLRGINGNVSDANYLSVTPPKSVAGLRIVANSTNAEDGKFRLVDWQVFEETGLASQLNQYVNNIGDTREGFLATQTNEINENMASLKEQMEKMQNRLDSKEASLWRKFNAMEQALGQLQNQSSYFSSMMGSVNTGSGGGGSK